AEPCSQKSQFSVSVRAAPFGRKEFYDHSRKRRWSFRDMEVVNDHLNRESHQAIGATDHGIVRAVFDWNPLPDPASTA
ncbi:hypothetical protein, partial [Pseudooceanicola nanhaiensis]|uniref:hypothetical protein n=1 Tax=Pseudooceanicola nanhaiensis TaxID=375761 RepID=UPI00300863F9